MAKTVGSFAPWEGSSLGHVAVGSAVCGSFCTARLDPSFLAASQDAPVLSALSLCHRATYFFGPYEGELLCIPEVQSCVCIHGSDIPLPLLSSVAQKPVSGPPHKQGKGLPRGVGSRCWGLGEAFQSVLSSSVWQEQGLSVESDFRVWL